MNTSGARSLRINKHKLQKPSAEHNVVYREKLISQINNDINTNCVIVQAPAGHGKTTLLRQVAIGSQDAGISTAWLTLDEADNDLFRLLAHLDEMISSVEAVIPDPQFIDANESSLPKSWAERFIVRLMDIGTTVHLFFDDFHCIDEHNVEILFTDVLRNIPSNIKIFIASRAIPNTGISDLQVHQRLLLLRYDELKFTLEEARCFFELGESLNLSENELQTIYSRSEGWPAALQLFRLTLSKESVKSSLSNLESYTPFQITEYLTSNVLQSQPQDVQEFVLKSSFMRRMTAPLCDAILGREDSQEILLHLEQCGVFLNNIDSEMVWFQFHGLFSNYLQKICTRRYPNIANHIHNLAAQWFYEQNLFEDSLLHAIEAENYTLAVEAMDLWASDQIANACLLSVERMADRIPLSAIKQKSELAVKVTWALTFLRRRRKVVPYLDILKHIGDDAVSPQFQIERQITRAVVEMSLDNLGTSLAILDSIDTEDHQATDFWAFELGAAANIQAFRQIALGNYSEARYHLAVGRNHTQDGKAPFPAGYNTALIIMNNYLQGRIDEAQERALAAIKAEDFDTEDSYAAASAICCAFYPLYESNDLDTVLKAFARYRRDIDTGLLLDFVAAAYFPVVRTYDACQDHSAANVLLEDLEGIAIAANWPRLTRLCHWEQVRRALQQGKTAEAVSLSSWLQKNAEQSGHPTFIDAIEDPLLGMLRVKAHICSEDELETVSEDIQREIDTSREHNRVAREIKLRLFAAILLSRHKKHERANKALKLALTLAHEYGFKRTVCDEGPVIGQRLTEVAQLNWPMTLNRFATELVDMLMGRSDSKLESNTAALSEALTKREMQMLTLLAKGEPNKSIARQLFVSENTVKFHLKNIYHKLGVSTRTQAISTALSAKLI